MKKKIVFFGAAVVFIALALFGLLLLKSTNKDKYKPDYTLKEYSIEKLPEFSFSINGNEIKKNIEITKEVLEQKSVPVYEFSKDIDNNWETVTNDYIGFTLKDILKEYEFDYQAIEFYEVDRYSVRFTKEEIDEDVYVIFYRDGKPLGEVEPIGLMSFSDKWNRSLTDFNYIFLYQSTQEEVPSESDTNVDESDRFDR